MSRKPLTKFFAVSNESGWRVTREREDGSRESATVPSFSSAIDFLRAYERARAIEDGQILHDQLMSEEIEEIYGGEE